MQNEIIDICGYCHWELHSRAEALPSKLKPFDFNIWASNIDQDALKLLEQYKLIILNARRMFYRQGRKRIK